MVRKHKRILRSPRYTKKRGTVIIAGNGKKDVKHYVYYYANQRTKDGRYIVLRVEGNVNDETESKARVIAKKNKLTLAGGLFTSSTIPFRFKEDYKVIIVPKKTKYVRRKRDLIDMLIDYESGNLSEKETGKFLKELKRRGLINKLQGHYGRVSERLGI